MYKRTVLIRSIEVVILDGIMWLEKWYISMCNGDWEHLYGVRIDTIDNPGWRIKIDLQETPYANIHMSPVKCDNGPDDWYFCSLEDGTFCGVGDTTKLSALIHAFRVCIETYDTEHTGMVIL